MDLIERLVGHDIWTTSEILRRCGELSDEQLDQALYIDHQSVRATLAHMIWNVEVWTDLMLNVPVDRSVERPVTLAGLVGRHERASERFRLLARWIADEQRFEDVWIDTLDNPPTEKTFGGAIAHVITHNMHHRAQLLYMLDRLGLKDLPEGDLLGWETTYRYQRSPGIV